MQLCLSLNNATRGQLSPIMGHGGHTWHDRLISTLQHVYLKHRCGFQHTPCVSVLRIIPDLCQSRGPLSITERVLSGLYYRLRRSSSQVKIGRHLRNFKSAFHCTPKHKIASLPISQLAPTGAQGVKMSVCLCDIMLKSALIQF